jgi:hypothetical protein
MPNTVEKAAGVVAALEAKRTRLIAHGVEIGDERANVALAAHTGDTAARKRLDEINAEVAVHASELASLDAALRAAGERLKKARQAEAARADKAAAGELLKELTRFRDIGRQLDVALAAVAANGHELHQSLGRVHALGSTFPTGQQLDALGFRCVLTALQQTPWRRNFEAVAPRERRSFAALIEVWCSTIESRLGEQTTKEADHEAA